MAEHTVKCPYCGQTFEQDELAMSSLIPTHDYPEPYQRVCPGRWQKPRSVNDNRPLWKEDV